MGLTWRSPSIPWAIPPGYEPVLLPRHLLQEWAVGLYHDMNDPMGWYHYHQVNTTTHAPEGWGRYIDYFYPIFMMVLIRPHGNFDKLLVGGDFWTMCINYVAHRIEWLIENVLERLLYGNHCQFLCIWSFVWYHESIISIRIYFHCVPMV